MKTLERLCSECGEPISSTRLKEKPHTTLCVHCKATSEKQPRAKTRENPEKVKQKKKHRLPESLENAILTLSQGKEIVVCWAARTGSSVADDLAKADALIKRFTAALAAKHVFDQVQLNKIRVALRQAEAKAASIVSKGMNADAKKIRLALTTINTKFENKKAVLSVNSKSRKFRYSIEEKVSLDEVDAMLSEAGIE